LGGPGIAYCDDCEYCDAGKTPCNINITLSGITNCSCFTWSTYSVKYLGVAECLNGTTWEIPQTDTNPCKYEKIFTDVCSEAYRYVYGYSSTCGGSSEIETLVNLDVDIEKVSTSRMQVSVCLRRTGISSTARYVMRHTESDIIFSGCMGCGFTEPFSCGDAEDQAAENVHIEIEDA